MAASGWAQQPPADPRPAAAPAPPVPATPPVIVVPAGDRDLQIQLELQAKQAADQAVAAQADAQAAQADAQALVAQVQGMAVGGDGQHMFAVAGRHAKKEKAAFLGVVAVPADPAMRDQLKLPRGIGLVIQQVTDESPAERAGIQQHDILMKVDDQWLVNSQQLGVVIRMHKGGDEVKVTLVRQGQQQTVTAKLEEKEMVIPESNEPNFVIGDNAFQGLTVPAPPGLPDVFTRWDKDDDADMIIKDNDRTLKIKVKNNEKHLVATDNNGQVLFDGPIQTDEQKKAVPADIAEELEKYKDQIDKLQESKPGEQKKIRIIKDGR
jgi:hypothetical protein